MEYEMVTINEMKHDAAAQGVTQITGDDLQLAEFWEKAHRYADNAGQCEVFDRIAEELGGPRRPKLVYFMVRRAIEYSHPVYGDITGLASMEVYGERPDVDAEGWVDGAYWEGEISPDMDEWFRNNYGRSTAFDEYLTVEAERNAARQVQDMKARADRAEAEIKAQAEIDELLAQLSKKD